MFPVDWPTLRRWAKNSKEPKRTYPPLIGEHRVDVAVVGGGLTGLSNALSLAKSGLKAIVLEGNAFGSGASGCNYGLVIAHHSKALPFHPVAIQGGRRIHGLPCWQDLESSAGKAAFKEGPSP